MSTPVAVPRRDESVRLTELYSLGTLEPPREERFDPYMWRAADGDCVQGCVFDRRLIPEAVRFAQRAPAPHP